MSLVGSLEDLGLGDILQIVGLARKSGRLLLRTDGESGRIVLRDGMVHGAVIKGEFEDLRGVLVNAGEISADGYECARQLAEDRDIPLDAALAESAEFSKERLDSIRRVHVERAVIRMFTWRAGEFSFEVRDDSDPEDAELLMPVGINTQYLAMEATRLCDEGDPPGPLETPADEGPLFSGENSASNPSAQLRPVPSLVEAMALASARSIEEDDEDTQTGIDLEPGIDSELGADPEPGIDSELGADPEPGIDSELGADLEPLPVLIEETHQPSPVEVSVEVAMPAAPETDARPADRLRERPPVVAIDRELRALEWLKLTVGDDFPRVHIFQQIEAGMDRIRRYLARGVVPLVLVSPVELNPERGCQDLIDRLRCLSAEMQVLALLSSPEAAAPQGLDGAVVRPTGLSPDPDHWAVHEPLRVELREALRVAADRGADRRGGPRPDAALENLRSVSDRLRDPGRRDDALSLVLEFASRSLSRVAMFVLRDDVAVGLAQRGMPRAGGPDDDELAVLQFSYDELPPLFHRAIEDRRGVRGRIGNSGSSEWTDCLGGSVPAEAYVAPIESGGCAVAVLYADNLPIDAPIGDMTALEIVLHEAGLALDRTLLERALAAARSTA